MGKTFMKLMIGIMVECISVATALLAQLAVINAFEDMLVVLLVINSIGCFILGWLLMLSFIDDIINE
jgi:fluoride ion exporter CrcB/FEX